MSTAPPPPRVRLSLGVTGHRASHLLYAANAVRIEAVIADVLNVIDAAVAAETPPFGAGSIAATRLHSLLADGADQIAAQSALGRGWELVAPLPFGRALNVAINAQVTTVADANALLAGGDAADPAAQARAHRIRSYYAQAQLFELADRDDVIAAHLLASLVAPADLAKAQTFAANSSERVALAARVMIEQSDFLIAVWDGAQHVFVGGTGHTIAAALELGAPVLWIDPANPEQWRVLRAPESLAARASPPPTADERASAIRALVHAAFAPAARKSPADERARSFAAERWRSSSNSLWHSYRRIEALFGGEKGRSPFRRLRMTYETPDAVAGGSGASVLAATQALPAGDPGFAAAIEAKVSRRFAWADGISSYLSDTYRGGMVANFALSALAIVIGIAYLPFATSNEKIYFAAIEFALLSAILLITTFGQRLRWHGRWFETRRVAEYFRHGPLLLALGVARAPGRWPRGTETSWPEWYARHGLREVGLPRITVSRAYLQAALATLLDTHVVQQRDYHHGKAHRLTTVHRNLDKLSEALFVLAVLSVAGYLALNGIAAWDHRWHGPVHSVSYLFTFLGVLLPTFGASIAGIRYFGDFERFAAISEVTAEKLDAVHARIAMLQSGGADAIDYALVSDLAHAADDIVVSEIENWQSVFGGKHVTVPV